MRTVKYLALGSLTVFAINACGDDSTSSVVVIPPDASFDASLLPDGSLGGNGGTGGSGGSGGSPVTDAGPDAAPVIPDASPDLDTGAETGPGPCEDGVQGSDELGVDCGSACSVACDNVFVPDASTLALFELNGDFSDSSGNGRDAEPFTAFADAGADAGDLENRWVTTEWGQGLSFPETSDLVAHAWGFDWSQYANLIDETFTIEMVFVTTTNDCYQRLFMFERGNDSGWYICESFSPYLNGSQTVYQPFSDGGTGNLVLDVRHYLALAVHPGPTQDASSTQSQVDVYIDGALAGTTGSSFIGSPTDAIFFEDLDTDEQFNGVVDSVRISNGNRSSAEIAAVWDKLNEQPL